MLIVPVRFVEGPKKQNKSSLRRFSEQTGRLNFSFVVVVAVFFLFCFLNKHRLVNMSLT